MRNRSVLVVSTVMLALVGAGTAVASPAAKKGTVVNVTAKDYSFVLSRKSVPHGPVTFAIENEGKAVHDFEIAGHTSKTIAPGKSTTLKVQLKAGRYPYKCTVDDHSMLGMRGVLRAT